MQREPVDSSMADEVGYDEEHEILEIQFKSQQVWQYHDVPVEVYEELISGSIGSYFGHYIRGCYPEVRIA